jgi:hypothetical protein
MHLQDVPNLGLWHTDFQTGQTSWSKEMFSIYGLNPEVHSPSIEVLIKYLHRNDRDTVSDSIHQATKSLKPFSFYHRIVRKDRSVRSLLSMGRFEIEANGKPTCRCGISLDITCLSKAEALEIKNQLAGVELPSLSLLLTLDIRDKHIARLLEIASMAAQKMRDKIASGNSSSGRLT